MARHSQPAGRFDRQCATARPSCSPYLLASRWIRPGLKIQSLKLPRAKKLTVLHSMFSYCCLFYAPAFGFRCVEPQLTLCDSITEMLRRRLRQRQVESLRQQRQNRSIGAIKGNRSVTGKRCEPEAGRFRNEI